MRKNQWDAIAVVFILGVIFFVFMGNMAGRGEILMRQADNLELGAGDIIFPLRNSLYFSFAFLCFLVFNVACINSLLEGRAEKREKEGKI